MNNIQDSEVDVQIKIDEMNMARLKNLATLDNCK